MNIQERVEWLSDQPKIQSIWNYLDDILIDILASAVLIQQIPSPTFNELVRANHVLSRLGSCGLVDTGIDDVFNAFGRLPGSDSTVPALLIAAHTDTVFSSETDLAVHHEDDGRIFGPGLGDNSVGVAGLIALADIFRQFDIQPKRDIWFLANSREEGLGDLGGIRAFHQSYGHKLETALILEGMLLGSIVHAGIAVRRLRITCHTDGGHSWNNFGDPSAIHSLLTIGTKLIEIEPPRSPRTTYNIGIIEGGRSVNTLASEATCYLDMRSEEKETLQALESEIRGIIMDNQTEGVKYTIEVVGDRPNGRIETDHDLVQAATRALQITYQDYAYRSGSTDGNWLLANDLPTVTIGLTTGQNAHRMDEFINTEPLQAGMRQLILLALSVAEWSPE